jgi:hypothetical protein
LFFEVCIVRLAAIVLLGLVLSGCATKTYYACRDSGSSREFCSGYSGVANGRAL